jgi:hypothetical protein
MFHALKAHSHAIRSAAPSSRAPEPHARSKHATLRSSKAPDDGDPQASRMHEALAASAPSCAGALRMHAAPFTSDRMTATSTQSQTPYKCSANSTGRSDLAAQGRPRTPSSQEMCVLRRAKSAIAASSTPLTQRYRSQANFDETGTDVQGYLAQNMLLRYSQPAAPEESIMALAKQLPKLVQRCVLSVCFCPFSCFISLQRSRVYYLLVLTCF